MVGRVCLLVSVGFGQFFFCCFLFQQNKSWAIFFREKSVEILMNKTLNITVSGFYVETSLDLISKILELAGVLELWKKILKPFSAVACAPQRCG